VSRYPKVSLAAVNVESVYDAYEGRPGFERTRTRDIDQLRAQFDSQLDPG